MDDFRSRAGIVSSEHQVQVAAIKIKRAEHPRLFIYPPPFKLVWHDNMRFQRPSYVLFYASYALFMGIFPSTVAIALAFP